MNKDELIIYNPTPYNSTNTQKATTLLLTMLTQTTSNYINCDNTDNDMNKMIKYATIAQSLSTTIKYLEEDSEYISELKIDE